MKIRFLKDEMIESVGIVSKAISSKSILPILSTIKITAAVSGYVTVEASCISMSIKHTIQAQVEQGGEIAVEARMFGEIIKRLPGDMIDFDSDADYVIRMKGGKSNFKIQGLSAAEFPATNEIENKYGFTISQNVLQSIIKKTIPFAAQGEGKKPILQGVLFDIRENELYAVASDGLRLTYIETHLHTDVEDKKIVIPAETLKNLPKFGKDDIEVVSDGRNMLFRYENCEITASLLDGEYLDYKRILQQETKIKVSVNKSDFLHSIDRVALIANSDNMLDGKKFNKPPARMNIKDGKIEITCVTNKGDVTDMVDAEINGGELIIGFNCDYIRDALNAYTEDTVTMEMSTPTSACILVDADGSKYMVLPVRMK